MTPRGLASLAELAEGARELRKSEVRVLVIDDARPESPWFGKSLTLDGYHFDGPDLILHAHVSGISVG